MNGQRLAAVHGLPFGAPSPHPPGAAGDSNLRCHAVTDAAATDVGRGASRGRWPSPVGGFVSRKNGHHLGLLTEGSSVRKSLEFFKSSLCLEKMSNFVQ